ncbi:MAG: hypothetical protein ABIQ18_32005 [Umezawaea sp.]
MSEISADALLNLIADSRKFPSTEFVNTAAALIPAMPVTELAGRASLLHEGPQWYVSVSPGRLRVWTRDEADRDRRINAERSLQSKAADALATWLRDADEGLELGDLLPKVVPSRTITEFSRVARTHMRGFFADLDYAPLFGTHGRPAAMLTVTYPGCWLRVAPNGTTVKKHLKALRKRFIRKFGEDMPCIWKLEFQYRIDKNTHVIKACTCEDCDGRDDGRAPHVHFLAVPPRVDKDGNAVNFPQWFSATWANIVAHPDPIHRANHLAAGTNVNWQKGLTMIDPRRVTTYFAKHSGAEGKEYQHRVPAAWSEPGEGPGRFYGAWVLKRHIATAQVRPQVGQEAGRVVRRYSSAQRVTRQATRPRVRMGRAISKYPDVIGLAGAQLLASRDTVKYRHTRTRAVRAKNNRGWVILNDGPAFAGALATVLHHHEQARRDDLIRASLERVGKWDTPLARALRLAPGPRRDALVATFRDRPRQSAA